MFNRKSKKKIAALEAKIDQRDQQDHQNGEHTKKGPFIPEYLGFEETVLKGVLNTTSARIYSKDGYNISKRVDTTRNEWIILDPNGTSNSLLIENMYNGVILLRACGMQISMYDYYQENKKMLDEMDAGINKDLKALQDAEEEEAPE